MAFPSDLYSLLGYLNPLTLTRMAWVQGRRGAGQLWRAPGPNARYFIYSSLLWSAPLALTNPYKSVFLSKLGLSNLAIGGYYALDMAVRVLGVLLGAGLATRFGHKRMLILGDFVSWIIPTLGLVFATEPWQAYLAACLYATNSLVGAAVQQLLLDGTPSERRANTFGLMNLSNILPGVLLPVAADWAVLRWEVVPAMRALFALQALSMLGGIWWRRHSLQESEAVQRGASLEQLFASALKAARYLAGQKGVWGILGVYVLANVGGNLWNGYFGLYATQALGQGSILGRAAQVSCVFLALGSLWFVPRLARWNSDKAFALSTGLNCLAPFCLGFMPGAWGLLGLSAIGGLAAASHGALLNAKVADLLPKGAEGLAFSFAIAAMLVASAVAFSLTGALFETRFSSFPWVCLGFSLAQTVIAVALLRGHGP